MKPHRAGDARGVEQAAQGQYARLLCRPLEPERGEARKLLGPRKRGIDGEGTRGQTVLPRIAADRTEVARAEKRRHIVAPVGDKLHSKAGKTGTLLHEGRIDAALVPVEHRGIVDDLVRLTVDDLVHVNGFGEVAPDVEELHAKGEARVGPQRVVAAKANGLVLVVAELAHGGRHHVLVGLEGIAREPVRLPLEPREVERLLCARCAGYG